MKNYSWTQVPQGALNINAAVLLSDPLRWLRHLLQKQLHRTRSFGALALINLAATSPNHHAASTFVPEPTPLRSSSLIPGLSEMWIRRMRKLSDQNQNTCSDFIQCECEMFGRGGASCRLSTSSSKLQLTASGQKVTHTHTHPQNLR